MKGENIYPKIQSCIQYLNNLFLRPLILLLKIEVRQVYEFKASLLLLANLNYLLIWIHNLKLSQYNKQKCILI